MKSKRFVVSAIAVFIFLHLFGFIWHGQLLADTYKQTASLWRSEKEMEELFHWIIINYALLALLVTYIYTLVMNSKGVANGIKFGTLVGLFIGILQSGTYAYMPITINLAMLWFFGSVVQGIGMGIILSLIYKKK